MPEFDFTATALWQNTLAARPRGDDHRAQRERLRASYLALRENAAPLLAENARSMPSFTVHDITHVDALWETADIICGEQVTLTPAEAYVLGCAFVLHDAAMGAAAYTVSLPDALGEERWHDLVSVTYFRKHGCWPDSEQLNTPPAEITEECRAIAIREAHAEQARHLVDQPWRSSAGNEILLIQDLQLRESYGPLIGDLAASHWWPVDTLSSQFRQAKGSLTWQPVEWLIEPLKLACVLRLADATQIDSRRAPTFLFSLRSPEGLSHEHWQFQEHVSRPHLRGDRVTYTSLRPFAPHAASAWWLALDYLRQVDGELKKVDALLHDLGRGRLAARAVAGVDSPERFAELFPVAGWRPLDAAVKISNVPALVETLGGEQLYGKAPEVAVRELIQNAQDAVLARQVVDPDFTNAQIEVRLVSSQGAWHLEVRDNGAGMDEETLVHGLLDFGSSGWSSPHIRNRLPGLASGGFKPKGRFGIGFFSVFMLGHHVELTTRRFDASMTDARRLTFDGSARRPLLAAVPASARTGAGTVVRIRLKEDPYETEGILRRTNDDRLTQLVRRLVLENGVPIRVWEPGAADAETVEPFTLATGSPEEVFDRLYPSLVDSWRVNQEKQRLRLREAFIERAGELLDDQHQRIGLAALGADLLYWSQLNYQGIVTVNGFLADESVGFAGYLAGQPNRASRDQARPVADQEQLRQWIRQQEQQLRATGNFTDPIQLELAYTQHRALGTIPDDVAFAMTTEGLLRPGGISQWAAQRSQVFLVQGGPPLNWRPRPPRVFDYLSGREMQLPHDWVLICSFAADVKLLALFPPALGRDGAFEFARHDTTLTWQKLWWRLSGDLSGLFLNALCAAWSCTIEDLLAPVEQRGWSDIAQHHDATIEPILGYSLRRPTTPPAPL
ncbi:ATP-binding protein [Streptomyces phaeochromogenes]|uniref:HD domain-containing protein n=1 Tax=Streptomyces phaeochromogenes TaxID=1923 RepID=UPI00386332A8|nr:ATP-binding protein [Streptomyces phaeochromogenes]